MLEKAIKTWNNWAQLGINKDLAESEQMKVILINQIAIAALLVNLVIFSFYLFNGNLAFLGLLFVVFALESIPLLLNYFGKYNLARFYFLSFAAILIFAIKCVLGMEVNADLAFIVLILIAFILFEKRINRIFYSILIVLLFIVSQYWVQIYPPVFQVQKADVYVMFLGCMLCSILIISIYLKEIAANRLAKESLMDELKEKNKNLNDTVVDLERFAYIASHDMKTPLRTVISFLGLIERKIETKEYEQIAEYLLYAKSGAKQMHFLVSDILEYSKLNHSPETKDYVSLDSVLKRVKMNLQEMISSTKVEIEADALPTFYCSDAQMMIVFQNLIENGIKYNNAEQAKLRIKSQKTATYYELKFIDNGIGIDNAYRETVFEMFKRLHTNDKYEGTGIGLAMCKKIVEQYEGTIQISNNETGGSCFTLRFPLSIDRLMVAEEAMVLMK